MLSGVVHPLDVLGLEISEDVNNENVQRYLYMLADCRSLLLNVSSQINEMRNTIAFQAINPSFTSTSLANANNYTMSPADFQAALVQQTTSAQAIQIANKSRNKKRQFINNNKQSLTDFSCATAGQLHQQQQQQQQSHLEQQKQQHCCIRTNKQPYIYNMIYLY